MRIESAAATDLGPVLALLALVKLPTEGVREHFGTAFVARHGDAVAGCAALEMYADGALLRSVAVAPDHRGEGLGRRLSQTAIRHAEGRGVPAVFLLTTTAERYFPSLGFEVIDRAMVPPGVQTSIEFTSACPSSAIVMRKVL